MTIALVLAGVAFGALGWAVTGASGIMQKENDPWSVFAKLMGIACIAAACTCFYIAGTMAGAQ